MPKKVDVPVPEYQCIACNKKVHKAKLFCMSCWNFLPFEIQEEICEGYDHTLMEKDEISPDLSAAIAGALAWFHDHLPVRND